MSTRVVIFISVVTAVFVADQVTKWMAVETLTDAFYASATQPAAESFGDQMDRFLWTEHPRPVERITILDNFWHFKYVENPGAAFGFLAGSSSSLRTPFFIVVTIIAMGFVLRMFYTSEENQGLMRLALALIMGGALGNFVDRIRLGYVIDFIDWHWYDAHWPTFNVADAGITVGVIFLMLEMVRETIREKRQAESSATGG